MVLVEFFKAVHEKPSSSELTSLKAEDGTLIQDQDGLSQACVDFYSNLYDARVDLPEYEAASNEFIQLLSEDVPQGAKEDLQQPITEPELHQALLAMAPDKSPGPDGFITEFYKQYWYLIGYEFAEMIQ